MITERDNKKYTTYSYLQDAPLPVVITSGFDLLIEFVNRAGIRIAGLPPEQILGTRLSEAFSEVFPLEVAKEIHDRCFVDNQHHVIDEQQIVYPGTTERTWFQIETQPLRDNEGRITGTISYFISVKDKVISRKSIDHREEFLSNFFKKAPIGIVCYRGEDFIVDLANDKALEMWGKTLTEVKGRAIREIFPQVETDDTIRLRHHESLQKLRKGETHAVHEVELVFNRDGTPHTGWYTYIHEPYTNAAGEIIGVMAVAIEVTEQVMARRKLQLITDAIPSLVSYLNRKEQYEFVNKAYEVWFGHSRNEILGKSLQEVLGEAAYRNLEPHIQNVFTGKNVAFENWVDYKDGGKKYIAATYVPHFDETNNVVGFFALVNDLTERKRFEESIQENEQRLRLITDGIKAGTFDIDLTTGTILLSKQIKLLLGFPEHKELDPETARSVIHSDDLPELVRQFQDLKSYGSNEFVALDYRIIRPDGVTRWMHTRSKVLFSEVGGVNKPSRIIGFTIDITERKQKEEQLRQFNSKLESEVKRRTVELRKVNRQLASRNQELTNSQSFLKQLVDSSVETIGVVDKDMRYILVNKAFQKLLNIRPEDVIGKTVTEVFPNAENSVQIEYINRALDGETINKNNYDSLVKPGMFVDTYYIPLTFGGAVEGVIIMARDVTEIVKAERELENLNRQLKEAQQLSNLGSWEWDIGTGKVQWSDEMYRIYGYEEKFPVNFDKAIELMSPAYAERSKKRMEQHLSMARENFQKTGEVIFEISTVEFPIQLPSGTRKILRGSGKLELSDEGKPARMLGAVQDVTEIRAAERALAEKNKLLELKNKELESFTYVASHDLQEPLRKILTYSDRIKNREGDKELDGYINKIDFSAQRMRNLIQSMLHYGRLSTVDDPQDYVDLNKVLKDIMADFELLILEKGAAIRSGSLPVLKASEYQMNQLFFNLISNSLKFCNNGPVITIASQKVMGADIQGTDADRNKEYWNLVFSDNGIGFDSNYKDQIFELFQRLHSTNEFSGTGIGLSIVKRIVERHNGFIEASSEPGKGATFSIWLPCD